MGPNRSIGIVNLVEIFSGLFLGFLYTCRKILITISKVNLGNLPLEQC